MFLRLQVLGIIKFVDHVVKFGKGVSGSSFCLSRHIPGEQAQ